MRRDAFSASLLSRHPWLLDANVWMLESEPGEPASPDLAGVWPIGNGWVFAHAGMRRPYNRLCGLTGPTYQTRADRSVEGVFGDTWLELRTERGLVAARHAIIGRPRESGVLVTSEGGRGTGAAVITVDFAPPDNPVLIRLVEVWGGARLGSEAVLDVHLPGGMPHDERRRSLLKVGEDGRVLILSALGPGRWAAPGRLEIRLSHLTAEGGVWLLPMVLAFGSDEAEAVSWLRQPFDVVELLEQTRAYHKLWLAHTYTPEVWPQNLAGPTSTARALEDLIETTKLNLKMQQSRPSGAVSPMVHFKGVWARDSNGPIRAFLAMGARDEALDILEYYYRASIVLGRVPNSAPLDLDVTGAGERDDWSTVPVPVAEVPSHIVLQHRWWLEAGGDAEVVRRHWPYLVRCVTGQHVSPDGLLPFHGDETYLHGALYAVYPERCGWPNDLIADDGERGYAPWSLDSTVLYAAALDALAWLAAQIGREVEARGYLDAADEARRVIERRFWQPARGYYAPAIYPLSGARHEAPFAPINLRPLLVGLYGRDHPHVRSNLDAVVDLIGFSSITPNCDYTAGAVPGYLLRNLLEVGSDLAPLALANLVAMASPAGEWAEVYGPGGVPAASYDPAHPNRVRPWESGISLDAIYRYFTVRRAAQEPEEDFRGMVRRERTFGPGASRAFVADHATADHAEQPTVPQRVVVLTADGADVSMAREMPEAHGGDSLLVVEPGRPFRGDYLARLLFDGSGSRTADVLILGASALAGDRRSMKPTWFWRTPEVTAALERFQAAGGRVVRPAGSA